MQRSPFSRWLIDSVRIVQRSPSSRCPLGRTPAANAAAPGGGFLRCSSPRLGSLFAAWDHPRHERTPQKPRKRLIIDPLRGSRRPDAGARPNAVRRGDARTTHTPSYATALENARTTHTPSHATALQGALTDERDACSGTSTGAPDFIQAAVTRIDLLEPERQAPIREEVVAPSTLRVGERLRA